MNALYTVKSSRIAGTSLGEVTSTARRQYHEIAKQTPRRTPYIRAAYFNKEKVFINTFWEHLNQKSPREKMRRLVLYSCGIELLRDSRMMPQSIQDSHTVIFYRFFGKTQQGVGFCVQVKHNVAKNRKELMSIFPVNH